MSDAAAQALFWTICIIAPLYWVLLGGRIRTPRLGSKRYGTLDELLDDLLPLLGFASPIVVRAKPRQDKLRIEGRIPGAQRRASVSFFAQPSIVLLFGKSFVRLELEVDRAVKVSFRRGPFGALELGTNDHARLERAFRANPMLRFALAAAFKDFAVDHILIWDGKLTATAKLKAIEPEDYPDLVKLLDRIARALEPAKLAVRVLGGERRALAGEHGEARCAFCHERVTGDEPDLVACALCGTVLHDACWTELGRCPVLGCTGAKPERGTARVT